MASGHQKLILILYFKETFSHHRFAELLLSLPKALFRWKPSEHDNGVRFLFLLQLDINQPFIKKLPFYTTVIYSSVLCLTDRVSVQSAFQRTSTGKSLPLFPHRTDILSGREVSATLHVSSPQAPPLRHSLPALCAFQIGSTVSFVNL